jgi:divalent metal cation (Fe/Co/Zn/Cd) transporter
VSATTDAELLRRGRSLEYATLGWNVVGVVVLAVAAVRAGSVALAGFGLDSAVEICASIVVLWQLPAATTPGATATRVGTAGAMRERRAMRLIGSGFVVLVIYVVAQVVVTVVTGGRPAPSLVGIAWTAMTGLVMLALAAGKARTGAALGNPVLTAEGRVTLIDAGLAGSVLAGLVFNATLGWWWADPLAGLVLVYYGAREARAALTHPAAA